MGGEKRVALIGVGRWGTNIKRTVEEMRGVRLAWVCDEDKKRLAELSNHYQKTTSCSEVLADDEIDGVIVATPGSTHARLALPFIKKGVSTFIEKPMATSMEEARQLRRAAKKSGAVVFVGHVHLYNPAYLKARELAKKVGKIRYVSFEGINDGPCRDDMSVLWDWGPHGVSMTLDLTESMPKKVMAWGATVLRPTVELPDVVMVRLQFAQRIVADCWLSWLGPQKRVRLTAVGTRGSIVFDDVAEKKVTVYQKGRTAGGEGKAGVSHPYYSGQAPLRETLTQFFKCVGSRQIPLTDIDNGVAVVSVLTEAERSIKQR